MRLKDIVPWGRSFDEYRRMFALTDADLSGRILGCADGPASFNAEAAALGMRVVSCDPIYVFGAAEIARRIQDCSGDVMSQVRRHAGAYVWDLFRGPEDLERCRLSSMRRFLLDFDRGRAQGRYVAGSLPTLPFADTRFDLALVSHLLFLYSAQLTPEFHQAAVAELLRVAQEVRIFPLVTLEGERSPEVAAVVAAGDAAGFAATIQVVPYHFQRGAFHMLRLEQNRRSAAGSRPDFSRP